MFDFKYIEGQNFNGFFSNEFSTWKISTSKLALVNTLTGWSKGVDDLEGLVAPEVRSK